jgi:hypothetical protein
MVDRFALLDAIKTANLHIADETKVSDLLDKAIALKLSGLPLAVARKLNPRVKAELSIALHHNITRVEALKVARLWEPGQKISSDESHTSIANRLGDLLNQKTVAKPAGSAVTNQMLDEIRDMQTKTASVPEFIRLVWEKAQASGLAAKVGRGSTAPKTLPALVKTLGISGTTLLSVCRAVYEEHSRAHTSLRGDPLSYREFDYLKSLESALQSEVEFPRVYKALVADTRIGTEEMKAIARKFTLHPAKSRRHALELIQDRHTSLMGARAREKATGGRGAA